MKKAQTTPSPRFIDALATIPEEWQELFAQYFVLATKHKTLNENIWKETFPTFSSSEAADFSNPDAPHLFEKNPITYLLYAHNSLVDFSGALNRILKLLYHQRQTPLSKNNFLILLDKVAMESEARNWLTPVLRKLFRTLILYPFASTKELASKLETKSSIVRQQIDRFRNRFHLNRVIAMDYYKFGLSRVLLFLTFKNRRNFHPCLPVTTRYFESEIVHRLNTFSDLFVIQSYLPPRRQWSTLKKLCEDKFNPNDVKWLGGAPRIFFREETTVLYNTETYDQLRKQWRINEDYLEVCLSTDLWQDLSRVDVSPALRLSCDINTLRMDFDLLDLKIAHYFYELEGNDNRFATVGTVAKALGIPYQTVKTRLQRMLKSGMVTFYYYTAFRLPRMAEIILLAEDPKIYDQYLNIAALLPCSFTSRIRSYPTKYVGIYSTFFLPYRSRVPYIFRDFFLSTPEVLTGFCAESQNIMAPKRPLWQNWDSIRKRWKWNELPEESIPVN